MSQTWIPKLKKDDPEEWELPHESALTPNYLPQSTISAALAALKKRSLETAEAPADTYRPSEPVKALTPPALQPPAEFEEEPLSGMNRFRPKVPPGKLPELWTLAWEMREGNMRNRPTPAWASAYITPASNVALKEPQQNDEDAAAGSVPGQKA